MDPVSGVAEKALSLLLSLLLLGQAYVVRLAVGTYLFPAGLMSLAWFLFTFVPLVVLIRLQAHPLAIAYINVCVLAFNLGALPYNWRAAFEANKTKTRSDYERLASPTIRNSFIVAAIGSVVTSTLSLLSNDVSLEVLASGLLETSGEFAVMRGRGELEYGLWGVLGTFFTYATPTLGGLVSSQARSRAGRWAVLAASFGPSIYYMLTQSQKLVLFFSVGFYYGATLLGRVFRNDLRLVDRSSLRRAALGLVLLAPLVAVSFVSRQGYSDFDTFAELARILSYLVNSYAFGQLFAFADFFTNYAGLGSQLRYVHDFGTNGYYTFKSLFDMLGGDKYFPPGTFLDSYQVEDVVSTNVYTIFRGLIYDFGGVGTVCFMFVSGVVAHGFFFRLLRVRRPWAASSAFIILVVFIQGTYLFSIFTARYVYLLALVFGAMLALNGRRSGGEAGILTARGEAGATPS